MEASRLFDDIQPRHPWLATDESQAWFVADLGTAIKIRSFWLGYTSVTGAAGADVEIRLRADASATVLRDTPGSAAYDSGEQDFWPVSTLDLTVEPFTHAFLWLGEAGQTYRYWRVDVLNLPSGQGFRAGRCYLSEGWRPQRAVDFGWTPAVGERRDSRVTLGGTRLPRRHPVVRGAAFQLTYLSAAQAHETLAIDRRRGVSRDVLAVIDPEATEEIHDRIFYGTFATLSGTPNMPKTRSERYRKTYAIEELP